MQFSKRWALTKRFACWLLESIVLLGFRCSGQKESNDQERDREVDGVEGRQADDGGLEEGRRDEQVDDNGNREEDSR